MGLIVWIRFFILLIFVLSLTYAVLWFRGRRRHKDWLEAEFAGGAGSEDKDIFMTKGMEAYGRKFKTRMQVTLFLLPVIIAGFLLYLAKFA